MTEAGSYLLQPIGVVQSQLRRREDAPRQGDEGVPEAWLLLTPQFIHALDGLAPGAEIIVLTWLHLGDRTAWRSIRARMLLLHPPEYSQPVHLTGQIPSDYTGPPC